jgi:SAM-dependent methyltransferase
LGSVDSIGALSRFLQSPPGRYVLAWEQQHLDAAVSDTFGYHALQLGLPEIDALRENRMLLRFCASDRRLDATRYHDTSGTGHTKVAVINRYEELPFASQSIDLVVMPHILEFADEPHQVLREVDRVLVPEGHLVITGFNPASLWGLRQAMARFGASPYLPRAGQFLSLPRIKDWLKLLSFEVNRGRFGCYVPSVRSDKWLVRWRWMEKAGDRWWPFLGSVYLVTAVKRVRGMRLVGAIKRRTPVHAVALTPAASRIAAFTGEAASVQMEPAPRAANDSAAVRRQPG